MAGRGVRVAVQVRPGAALVVVSGPRGRAGGAVGTAHAPGTPSARLSASTATHVPLAVAGGLLVVRPPRARAPRAGGTPQAAVVAG